MRLLDARDEANAYSRLKPGPHQPGIDVGRHQRDRIQLAFVELVSSAGYESVTVRKLTKLAHVSTGTFYSQFKGVDDCLVSTYERVMGRVRSEILSTRDPARTPRAQAALSLRVLSEALQAEPHAARLALTEVFAGGPAAVARARLEEDRLEAALRECLDRRGGRVSSTSLRWVTAGALYCLRAGMEADGSSAEARDLVEDVTRWGERLVDVQAPVRGEPGSQGESELPSRNPPPSVSVSPHDGETETLLCALAKLAEGRGYWTLDIAQASRGAGIPATRFRQHFTSLQEAFLTVVRRTALQLFEGLIAKVDDGGCWHARVRCGVGDLIDAVLADPVSARLPLCRVLEPGLSGFTWREALIGEIAVTWCATLPASRRPERLTAEAAIASLWAVVGRALDSGKRERLRKAGPWLSEMLLVSLGEDLSVSDGQIRNIAT
jgi:AcrR family transcriptional regulator